MKSLAAAVLGTLLLTAQPALAAVNTEGDVKPVAPAGFGVPDPALFPGVDENGDNIADWISAQGNVVLSNLVDPDNPAGGPGGLAWNDPIVWRDYDTPQNILVGELGLGVLEINGGSALRYQNLVLGGESDSEAGQLSLEAGDMNGDDYNTDFLQDIADLQTSRTGVGIVTVTGVGSVFNNDPNLIPGDLQTALNFANGDDIGTFVTTTPDDFARDENVGFDVHVGLLGSGQLNVTAGGRVEIQDGLFVGSASTAQGDVIVDGFGSYLAAYGRVDFDPDGVSGPNPGVFTSYIGGNGRGSLTVSEAGRADFFNGLSIGAANDLVGLGIIEPGINPDPQSTGSVVVTGNGSVLTVDAAIGGLIQNNAALAIGELRTDPTTTQRYSTAGEPINAPDGTSTLGDGSLRVEDGARVTVTGFGDTQVGYNGVVELRGGSFNAGDLITNDGRIDGVGDLRGRLLDTSVYSIIRGGDPLAEPSNPSAEPLRIVLSGASAGDGAGVDLDTPTFTNRGLVEGLIDLRVTGDIQNGGNIVGPGNPAITGGRIEAGGQITARSIISNGQSRIVGTSSTGSPLRIRLDSQDQVDEDGDVDFAMGAFQNFGLLGGEIDLVTPGGLANGANLSTAQGIAADPGPPNGGTINVNGTLQVGTFINHALGLVRVDPGKSLSILSTAVNPVLLPEVVEDGIDSSAAALDGVIDASGTAAFTQANLGQIIVNGGTFEAGWLEDTREGVVDGAIDHFRLFRNARFVIGADPRIGPAVETVGTITSTDGTLDFREGIYNTGVVAFDGGSNLVRGEVFNAGFFRPGDPDPDGDPMTDDGFPNSNGLEYAGGVIRPGVILVSGDNTSVTFQDRVLNDGIISIGPNGNVANFLGDLENRGGTIQIALPFFPSDGVSAYITVGGDVRINGGSIILGGGAGTVDPTIVTSLATSPTPVALATAAATAPEDFSLTILSADGELSPDSLFTDLSLPDLPDGVYWDVIYDLAADQVRLEMVESSAIGADFNNDNIVDQFDIDIWARNAGITGGASIVQGDVNMDGAVDLGDYELMMQQIFSGGQPVAFALAVPEPTSLMLLVLAGLGLASRRR